MQTSITNPQLLKLHRLLKNAGLLSDEREYISHFTLGRKSSTEELTTLEASCLIMLMAELDPEEKVRCEIIRLAYEGNIIYGYTLDDKVINDVALDNYLKKNAVVKKSLNDMNLNELEMVYQQLQRGAEVRQNSKNRKEARQLTSKLLNELNITVK